MSFDLSHLHVGLDCAVHVDGDGRGMVLVVHSEHGASVVPSRGRLGEGGCHPACTPQIDFGRYAYIMNIQEFEYCWTGFIHTNEKKGFHN
jgi:hypothetical protein